MEKKGNDYSQGGSCSGRREYFSTYYAERRQGAHKKGVKFSSRKGNMYGGLERGGEGPGSKGKKVKPRRFSQEKEKSQNLNRRAAMMGKRSLPGRERSISGGKNLHKIFISKKNTRLARKKKEKKGCLSLSAHLPAEGGAAFLFSQDKKEELSTIGKGRGVLWEKKELGSLQFPKGRITMGGWKKRISYLRRVMACS